MSHENLSGRVYKFKLDFNLGIAFMQLIDNTHLNEFNGKLVIVFNQFSNDDFNLYDKSIFLGPLVVNKFPPLKGIKKFLHVCNTDVEIKSFYIKNLQGLLWKNDDWSQLSPWHTYNLYNSDERTENVDYNSIRHLETSILNHVDTTIMKTTMLFLLNNGKNVEEYYDLSDLGNRNVYLQVVNTYVSIDKALKLIKRLKPYGSNS